MTKSYKYFFPLVILAISVLGFVSCKKDKDPPVIIITPSQLHIVGNVNDVVAFKIEVKSNVRLSKFVIKSQPENTTPILLLDTSITSKSSTFNYYFKLPANLAGKSTNISFLAEDQNGLTSENFRVVFVNAPPAITPKALTETAGHRMYRFRSTGFDAYNLETNAGVFSLIADSTARDIQDLSDTTNTTLSRNWQSPAKGNFILYTGGTGFDYANATDSTTIGAYNAGLKTSLLFNLQVGDVIITKLGSVSTNKYVVLRLTNILDDVGKNNDYYEFSIKK